MNRISRYLAPQFPQLAWLAGLLIGPYGYLTAKVPQEIKDAYPQFGLGWAFLLVLGLLCSLFSKVQKKPRFSQVLALFCWAFGGLAVFREQWEWMGNMNRGLSFRAAIVFEPGRLLTPSAFLAVAILLTVIPHRQKESSS